MRDSSVRIFFLFASSAAAVVAAALGACHATPAITVVRTAQEKAEEVQGDRVKLKRGEQEPWSGARGGYYVVRNEEDWKVAGADKPLPPLDNKSFMVFLGVAESSQITELKITRAVETSEMLYVWAKETRIGQGCQNKSPDRAFDAVTTARADKPVKFFVDEETGENCGDAPEAKVLCRKKSDQKWSAKVDVEPGDKVECELSASARGKFELIDRSMNIELPAGSSTKLAFIGGPVRGEFGIDVYGTYTVRGEAADEGGRHGKAWATIDAHPPKTEDVLVQLVWAGFDRKDDPATFPRVNLRVAEEGPKGQRCSADVPVPGLCEVKTRAPYTYMRIPESKRKLPVSVQYLDERAEKGPGPCVHVWYDGVRTTEMCDRKHRSADEIWNLGSLDTTTGKIELEVPNPDAGAPRDAGPPPKPAPPKKPAAPKK